MVFVQSEKFVEAHGGRIGDIGVFGQESNPTTWKLAKMNLTILVHWLMFLRLCAPAPSTIPAGILLELWAQYAPPQTARSTVR